jgi:hypothetical protein
MLFLAFCSGSGKFKEQTVRSNVVLAVERTAANPRTFALACELITRLRASTGTSDKDAVQFCGRTHLSCGRTHLHKTATFFAACELIARLHASTEPLQRRSALLRSNAPLLRSNALEKKKLPHFFFYLFDFLYLFIVSACFLFAVSSFC